MVVVVVRRRGSAGPVLPLWYYLHNENELSRSRLTKIRALLTDRQTDRHTDRRD